MEEQLPEPSVCHHNPHSSLQIGLRGGFAVSAKGSWDAGKLLWEKGRVFVSEVSSLLTHSLPYPSMILTPIPTHSMYYSNMILTPVPTDALSYPSMILTPIPTHSLSYSSMILTPIPTHSLPYLSMILTPVETCEVPPAPTIRNYQHQLSVLLFNPSLTLCTWRWSLTPTGYGLSVA